MTDDPIGVLERELVDAARRRPGGRRAGRRRPGVGALATTALVAVTLAVAGGALILLGGHMRPVTAPAANASKQRLIEILAVLRRPQTKADLNPRVLSQLGDLPLQGAPDLPLVRFATTTPWGEKLYFVPMKSPTIKQLKSAPGMRLAPKLIASLLLRGETLSVFSSRGGGGASTASDIEDGYAMGTEGTGRSFAGGATQTRLIMVLPDGVAKVEFGLARQSAGTVTGAPVYKHSLEIAVPVHNNIAAVQVDRQCCNGRPPMIWYAADGQVIKRIGNFSNPNQVIATPKPGPETALSRAAEQNPSTPHPVWVTPAIGGPHANFRLHFRVLLTDADYSYRLTGTRCPAITVNGGDGGGGALGLRGRIWSDAVDAVDGQTWCPGTYHLSATVMDLGRYGMLKQPARPFGTATFTVRP